MKKTLLFITHASIMAVGVIAGYMITSHKFLNDVIPESASYILTDARYIELPHSPEGNTSYSEIIQQRYIGNLYLRSKYYNKSHRSQGIQLLEELAKLGYTPAANDLYDYYFFKAHDFKALNDEGTFIVTSEEDFNNAHKWARFSAEHGDISNISRLIFIYKIDRIQDVSNELELIEKYALTSSIPAHAEYLSQYYARRKSPEKAEYWRKVAEEIEARPFKRAANEVITPWRGR